VEDWERLSPRRTRLQQDVPAEDLLQYFVCQKPPKYVPIETVIGSGIEIPGPCGDRERLPSAATVSSKDFQDFYFVALTPPR
jgi:hypothetical protein